MKEQLACASYISVSLHQHYVSLKCGFLDTSGFSKFITERKLKESNAPHVTYRIICTLFLTLYINFYPDESTRHMPTALSYVELSPGVQCIIAGPIFCAVSQAHLDAVTKL